MSNDVEATSEAGAEAHRITLDEFRKELKAKGLTEKFLVRKLKQGLNAKITRVFNHGGLILYSDPLVDYETRRKYLDMALKLEDLYPTEKKEITGRDGGPVEVTVIDKFELTSPGGTETEDEGGEDTP